MHLETILPTIGYLGISFIVFAESGLFFGFFLPGDSLLFAAFDLNFFLCGNEHLKDKFLETHVEGALL